MMNWKDKLRKFGYDYTMYGLMYNQLILNITLILLAMQNMDNNTDNKHIKLNPVDYEPERLNRFLVRFPFEVGLQEWWMSKFKKPSYNFKTKTWGRMEFSMRAAFSSDYENWHPYMKYSEAIKNFERYNELNYEYVDFEELDPTGKVISKVRYSNCLIF